MLLKSSFNYFQESFRSSTLSRRTDSQHVHSWFKLGAISESESTYLFNSFSWFRHAIGILYFPRYHSFSPLSQWALQLQIYLSEFHEYSLNGRRNDSDAPSRSARSAAVWSITFAYYVLGTNNGACSNRASISVSLWACCRAMMKKGSPYPLDDVQ